MPQPTPTKRPRRRPHPLRSVHRHHPFWGRVLLVLHWLWRMIWWVWAAIIFSTIILGAVGNWITTGKFDLDVPNWPVWRLAEAHPKYAVAIVAAIAVLTLMAWVGERLYQRKLPDSIELEFILRPVREVDPEADLKLAKYVDGVYLERRNAGGGDADGKARAALRAAAKRPEDVPRETPIGICVFGQPALGKTRLAWEAMRGALAGWLDAPALAHEPSGLRL